MLGNFLESLGESNEYYIAFTTYTLAFYFDLHFSASFFWVLVAY